MQQIMFIAVPIAPFVFIGGLIGFTSRYGPDD